jgi:1,4-dihydroxy-2-naphthoate octaprenyltransferase
MGPLMVIGGYLAVTGTWTASVLVASLPVGALVAAILASNNLRDVRDDAEAGITTVARLLGHRGGQLEYAVLVIGAYGLAGLPSALGIASPWTLLPLLSAPLAVQAVARVLRSRAGHPTDLAGADVSTARLHALFGLLLIAGVVIGAL